jgi:hypothetical protein
MKKEEAEHKFVEIKVWAKRSRASPITLAVAAAASLARTRCCVYSS